MLVPIQVVAALVFDAGRLLITQRPADKHLGGLWEFPGGKLEAEESFQDCLHRELQEELGIEVAIGPLLAAIEHNYPEKTVHIHFYQCTLRSGVPTPIECQALEWVTAMTLSDYSFPPADTGLLAELKAKPELWETNS
ncbi:MAG: CTP pyrophosphohydrolase [Verrucomicrobia subdivision 3 bacterium]|nr:CTP pyrophosphohydrolase [Limisphaerales bacterium]MCS1413564.1 CTP pyrophosphohydrolase [Limisphaerales bacterium]